MLKKLKQMWFCLTGVSVSAILLTSIILKIYKQTTFYENVFKTELDNSSDTVIGWNKSKDDAIPWTSNNLTRSHMNEPRIKKDPWTSSSGYADFMNMPQIRYSPMFKNPCWHGSHGNGPLQDNRIHCIPYFYIIGVMKCGTTDLFQRLKFHPEVVSSGFKESKWFGYDRSKKVFDSSRVSQRFAKEYGATDPRRLDFYIKMYDHAAKSIQDSPTFLENGTNIYTHVTAGTGKLHSVLTRREIEHVDFAAVTYTLPVDGAIQGDACPSIITINTRWWLLPGNENLTEPNTTNLHCIKELNPAAKIIVMLRDPVKRLYSNYLFLLRGQASKYSFHEMLRRSTDSFNMCLTNHSLRWCIYNNAMGRENAKFRLDLGIYAFYLKEVWSVFDKAQVMTILLDDYHKDMRSMLQRVIEFLELRQLNRPEMDILLNLRIQNDKSYLREQIGPMLPETESLLRTFYQPYNKDMAKLMEDDKYLFQ